MSIKELIDSAYADVSIVAAGMIEGVELGRLNAARHRLEKASEEAAKLPVKRVAKAPAKAKETAKK